MANSGNRGRLSLIACNSGQRFAERVQKHLAELIKIADGSSQTLLRKSQEIRFANGEIKTTIEENIRGDDVYVFQCVDDPTSSRSVNDNHMALLTALHAVHNSDADSITAVIPQFPYSRQERKKARESITARLVASHLEDAGTNRVITLDIHAQAIEGFFQRTLLEDLHASKDIIKFFETNVRVSNDHLCVVAPDTGGANMARYYSTQFKCALAVVDKARDYSQASVIESMRLVGDVRGKTVLMPDDLIATGGTLVNACKLLKDQGAERIFVACSLPFFNGDAVEKLAAAHKQGLFEMVIGTDAVDHGPHFVAQNPWYREVSVARLFAEVIFRINRRRSVSELLK
jgi:ribose-phosphate pyrophosphokinase